ncbi:MAG: hypothetical protein OEW15_17580 [Nitrospirota bacterium]|nr:hypothetical protein [Nitrospirota bacterium]
MLKTIKTTIQNIRYFRFYTWAVFHFSDYKPQPVTIPRVAKWLSQFDEKDKQSIIDLLHQVNYISEKQTESLIVKLHANLWERLAAVNITSKNIIYVHLHDPGSSSSVMLNMLRDRALLERRGSHFVDSKNVRELHEITSKLEQGAIIYVDDFSGSGDQFCEVRDYLKDYIVGNFSEFFLLPCICEEAIYELGKRGIEAVAEILHAKADRPLHNMSSIIDKRTKNRLVEISHKIDKRGGLGYKSMATMVVFYRNAPTSTPSLLRGNIKQKPFVGILPRTTDLPVTS